MHPVLIIILMYFGLFFLKKISLQADYCKLDLIFYGHISH